MEKPSNRDWTFINANESNRKPRALRNLDLTGFDFHRYPSSEPSQLKESVIRQLTSIMSRFEPECAYPFLSEENLIMGTGSDEILKLILETFLGKDGVVLMPSPSFSEYKKITEAVKGRWVEVVSDQLTADIDVLIQAARKESADVIFLANPNNPTGQLFDLSEIKRLLKETNAIIVVDEAYAEFCAITAINLAVQHPRLIVTRTLSKAYGLASLRIGYAVATEGVIEQMNALRLTYNISGISEWLAVEALRDPKAVEPYLDQVIQLRGKAIWMLSQFDFINLYPSAANFLLIELLDQTLYEVWNQSLAEEKIKVRSFEQTSGRLSRCVRVTLTDEHEFMLFYNTLKRLEGDRHDRT